MKVIIVVKAAEDMTAVGVVMAVKVMATAVAVVMSILELC